MASPNGKSQGIPQQVRRWYRDGIPSQSEIFREEGEGVLRRTLADLDQRLAAKRPHCSYLAGVPDADLFWPEHRGVRDWLDTLTYRDICQNRYIPVSSGCWTDPQVPQRCRVVGWYRQNVRIGAVDAPGSKNGDGG